MTLPDGITLAGGRLRVRVRGGDVDVTKCFAPSALTDAVTYRIAGWWGPSWTLEEVSKAAGHSSLSVTERYAKLAPSVLDARAATMPRPAGRKDVRISAKNLSHLGDLKSTVSAKPPANTRVVGRSGTRIGDAVLTLLEARLRGEINLTPEAITALLALLPDALARVGESEAVG